MTASKSQYYGEYDRRVGAPVPREAKGFFPRQFEELLARADIRVNGGRPWDIQVHDQRLYRRVLTSGALGLGEAYMDGWWSARQLDRCLEMLLRARLDRKVAPWMHSASQLLGMLVNWQTEARSYIVGKKHYDIGNDLYAAMLDRRRIYSCGYWREASTLDEAQEHKLRLIGDKLGLQSGMRILDIGCGWGGAARYFAEQFGVEVVGVTISREQARYAEEHCAGLPVEIRLQDYRKVSESFDRVFSVGMFEHVGYKNYATYMQAVRRCLKPDGLFLLHTIGNNKTLYRGNPWISKYIFPNSMLPSVRQVGHAIEDRFVMEDWHNFGADYDRTLMAWLANFQNAWERLRERYDERFYRMWLFYLCGCAASFRVRDAQLWQIVLSPEGVPGGYHAPR